MIADLNIKEEPNWDWFLLLVAKTGMRFSEALAVTPSDFDFARQTLSVSKTWDYKGEGDFFLPISAYYPGAGKQRCRSGNEYIVRPVTIIENAYADHF